MTTGVLVLAVITGALLLLGGWIGSCIDAKRRAANVEYAALLLSRQIADELDQLRLQSHSPPPLGRH